MLRIKVDFGEFWPPHCPQMTDVSPNRCGDDETLHGYIRVKSNI